MIPPPFRSPLDVELGLLGLEVERGDELWIKTVTVTARDQSVVKVTWDEILGSVGVRVWRGETMVLRTYRETAVALIVTSDSGLVSFRASFESDTLKGSLSVDVGDVVVIDESSLMH